MSRGRFEESLDRLEREGKRVTDQLGVVVARVGRAPAGEDVAQLAGRPSADRAGLRPRDENRRQQEAGGSMSHDGGHGHFLEDSARQCSPTRRSRAAPSFPARMRFHARRLKPPCAVPDRAPAGPSELMCRFVAYQGHPVLLADLLYRPRHSLVAQSTGSEEMSQTMNGDGFGVGWYSPRSTPNRAW